MKSVISVALSRLGSGYLDWSVREIYSRLMLLDLIVSVVVLGQLDR